MKQPPIGSKDNFLKKYDRDYLLKVWAALSLLPENHGKNGRLDELTTETLLHGKSTKQIPSVKETDAFLKRYYDFNMDEDPVTNLFTDLLIYYGGDHLMLPGIMGSGLYILSNLVKVISFSGSELPIPFVANAKQIIKLIVGLSNKVTLSAGLKRYMSGSASDKYITVPTLKQLENLLGAITFSDSEMNQFLQDESISKGALSEFIIDTKDLNNAFTNKSPVLLKPILFNGRDYIVISPTNLAYALLEYLWKMAEDWNCSNLLAELYHNYVWHSVSNILIQMDFEPVNIANPVLGIDDDKIWWGVYKFDDNKIALVEYFFDDATDYTTDEYGKLDSHISNVEKENLFSSLRTYFKDHEIFYVSLMSTVGRNCMLPVMKMSEAKSLHIPVPEFEVMSQLNEFNAIDLWKFSISRDAQMPNNIIVSSFLDYYTLYKEHASSFYLSDEGQYSHIHLEDGYGSLEMLAKARRNTDIHSVLRVGDEGTRGYVEVYKVEKHSNIYVNKSDLLSNTLYFLVDNLPQPVWIKMDMEDYHKSLRSLVYRFVETLSYWLWQASNYIFDKIQQLGKEPITISFELQNPDKFIELDKTPSDFQVMQNGFDLKIIENEVLILIPETIISFLYMPNNMGERELLRQMLLGINGIFSERSLQGLEDSQIDEIIESVAPLGLKKKLLLMDTANNMLLDDRHLQPYRYTQEHDTSNVLDMIVPLLGSKCPPVGEVSDKKQKIALTRNIVAALASHLTVQLNKYNCDDLIRCLIGRYESLIQRREYITLTTPTRQECYRLSDDFLHELRDERSNLSGTTIAVRCLIEHVAAEQAKGTCELNITVVDELIALMDQIMTWGSLGDQLNFDLFDIDISILPNGRVGTVKKDFNEIFEPYALSKTQEDVNDFKRVFSSNFNLRESSDSTLFPKNIDDAFLNDYGISFLRICHFLDTVSVIGANQPHDYCCHDAATFFDAVNNETDNVFSKEEFDAAIEYLTLRYRVKVTNKPEGCDNYDISPWRFNRRLSLLRCPLVLIEDSENGKPMYYWGFRSTLMTKQYLFNSLQAGRLRVSDGSHVSKVMGKLANHRGDSLVDKVKEILDKSGLLIDTEVTIAPKGKLYNPDDLGDIDCLVIDHISKTIFSLECKAMEPSRNIKEMVEELAKLMGSESERGWIEKHTRREEWLKSNIKLVEEQYGVNLEGYSIKSVFITREQMITPLLLKNLPLPFITLYDLEEKGFECLSQL